MLADREILRGMEEAAEMIRDDELRRNRARIVGRARNDSALYGKSPREAVTGRQIGRT
jgi:hypothetical protein